VGAFLLFFALAALLGQSFIALGLIMEILYFRINSQYCGIAGCFYSLSVGNHF
jgi:hypothetical protein